VKQQAAEKAAAEQRAAEKAKAEAAALAAKQAEQQAEEIKQADAAQAKAKADAEAAKVAQPPAAGGTDSVADATAATKAPAGSGVKGVKASAASLDEIGKFDAQLQALRTKLKPFMDDTNTKKVRTRSVRSMLRIPCSAKLIKRRSDGVGDQAAEDALQECTYLERILRSVLEAVCRVIERLFFQRLHG
jgi:hypothetical protein